MVTKEQLHVSLVRRLARAVFSLHLVRVLFSFASGSFYINKKYSKGEEKLQRWRMVWNKLIDWLLLA